MLCQNCGKNEVTFRYTQVINGVKKEMALCDKCAKSLGLESLDFNMPINFSSFLGDFFGEGMEEGFLPSFTQTGTLECDNCGMSYDEFIETGKFGCEHCYDVFSNGLDNVLKNIHGSSSHVGRRSRLSKEEINNVAQDVKNAENNKKAKTTQIKNGAKNMKDKKNAQNPDGIVKNEKELAKEEKLKELNEQLKIAIKEERYEDAAKIRDEIKGL